jgi:hypothetical protein
MVAGECIAVKRAVVWVHRFDRESIMLGEDTQAKRMGNRVEKEVGQHLPVSSRITVHRQIGLALEIWGQILFCHAGLLAASRNFPAASRDIHARSAHQGNFWQQTAESGMQVPERDLERQ